MSFGTAFLCLNASFQDLVGHGKDALGAAFGYGFASKPVLDVAATAL